MKPDLFTLDKDPLVYFLLHSGVFVAGLGLLFFLLGLWMGWVVWARHKRRVRLLMLEDTELREEIADLKRKLAAVTLPLSPTSTEPQLSGKTRQERTVTQALGNGPIPLAQDTQPGPAAQSTPVPKLGPGASMPDASAAPAAERIFPPAPAVPLPVALSKQMPPAPEPARPAAEPTRSSRPVSTPFSKSAPENTVPPEPKLPKPAGEVAFLVGEPAWEAAPESPLLGDEELKKMGPLVTGLSSLGKEPAKLAVPKEAEPPVEPFSFLMDDAARPPETPAFKEAPKATPGPRPQLLGLARALENVNRLPTVPASVEPPAGTENDLLLGPIFRQPPAQADDLTRIQGITPAIQVHLAALGIYTHRQIAGWTARNIKEVSLRLAFKDRIEREQWVQQARLLVMGPQNG